MMEKTGMPFSSIFHEIRKLLFIERRMLNVG